MDSLNNSCKLGSDAWLELQAFKNRQLNRREKLNRNRDLINGIILNNRHPHKSNITAPIYNASGSSNQAKPSLYDQASEPGTANPSHLKSTSNRLDDPNESSLCFNTEELNASTDSIIPKTQSFDEPKNNSPPTNHDNSTTGVQENNHNRVNLELVECLLLLKLCDVALKLPIDSRILTRSICRIKGLNGTTQSLVENLLQKFAHQELITIEEPSTAILNRRKKSQMNVVTLHEDNDDDDESYIYVTSADHTKLVEFDKSFGSSDNIRTLLLESKTSDDSEKDELNDHLAISQFSSVPIQTVKLTQNPPDNLYNGRIDISDQERSFKNRIENRKGVKLHNDDYIKNCSLGSNASLYTERQQQSRDDVESLLSLSSTKERESQKLGEELLELLSKPTAKERNLMERFRSADGYQVQEFCPKGTKGECNRNNNGAGPCEKLHFKKIIAKHTEESLGDCSFLNTCFHMDSCKYVHYEVDYNDNQQFKRPHLPDNKNSSDRHNKPIYKNGKFSFNRSERDIPSSDNNNNNGPKNGRVEKSSPNSDDSKMIPSKFKEHFVSSHSGHSKRFKTVLYPPQWIQCDLRFFDMSLLGKFSVVMADPPWDIHMELPYGTMSDDEMRKLNVPALQDEGVIFLWVTGRAMELGRECLALWGYERCDEIIWVKTNQLQRIIRTGRTGHWLNHGKEHCLVGVKGNPKDINRGLDCDVIVAEVRATSHKPDEIYGIIERLSPGTRKIELFGRQHNVQPNWITLGNQLDGVKLIDPKLVATFKKLNMPIDHVGPI